MTTKVRSRPERQLDTYGADGQPTILGVEVSSGRGVEIPADAELGTNPSSRIGGVFDPAPVADQRVGRKGLHYTRCLGTLLLVIRGGGCGGKLSLSCWIRSRNSGSGWV